MYVSVVVPVYNVEKYIRECILSILNQTMKNIEIIIVNDGTKDNSIEVIKDLIEIHSNIKLINQKNSGLSAARNTGLKNATGEYIAFIDSDDYIEQHFIEVLYKRAKEFDLDIAAGSYTLLYEPYRVEESNRNPVILKNKVISGSQFLLNQLEAKDYKMEVWDDLYRRELLINNELKFVDGLLHEDEDFTPTVLLKAKRVMAIENYGYIYRQRDNSIMSSGFSEKNILSLEKTFNKFLKKFNQSDDRIEKQAIARLMLHLGESLIDRINLANMNKKSEVYNRIHIVELINIIRFGGEMSTKQKIKFYSLSVHYKLFECIVNTQKLLKKGW